MQNTELKSSTQMLACLVAMQLWYNLSKTDSIFKENGDRLVYESCRDWLADLTFELVSLAI